MSVDKGAGTEAARGSQADWMDTARSVRPFGRFCIDAGQSRRIMTCNATASALLPCATSRVELTLNANLLPGKVASLTRGDAADPATNGTPPHVVSFALVEQV